MQIIVVIVTFIAIYFIVDHIYLRNWDKNLEINVDFSTRSAFEGDKIHLVETITNRKLLPLPWLSVKFRVSRSLQFLDESLEKGVGVLSDAYYRNDMFSIIMFQKMIRTLPCICRKRGYYTIKIADVISSNAFVNKKFVGQVPCAAALAVYPKLIDICEFEAPFNRVMGSIIANKYLYPDPFEFRGIREYEPYDPLKSVNFKASAKTGVLMSNVYNHTVSQEVIIVLNVQRYLTWSSDIVFEQAIRMAATIAADYIEEGVPVALISNGKDIITGDNIEVKSGSGGSHLNTIYESLARLDYDRYIEPMTESLRDISDSMYREPIYIIISPYCGKDLQTEFDELCGNSFDSLWIVPVVPSDVEKLKIDEIIRENIIKWEVLYDDV